MDIHAASRVALVLAVQLLTASAALAQTPSFVAPPRSTADIDAILKNEKPDAERVSKLQARAAAQVPQTTDKKALSRFYFERGDARGELGRVKEGIADIEHAIALGREENMGNVLLRYQLILGALHGWAGNTQRSLDVFTQVDNESRAISPLQQSRINAQRWMGINYIALGDLDKAEAMMAANRELLAALSKRPNWATDAFRTTAEAHIAFGDAAVLEARGKFLEAAQAYRDAETHFRETLRRPEMANQSPSRYGIEQVSEWMVARAARVEARGGQLAEAEADIRRSLLNWIKLGGKYNLNTARIVGVFASVMIEQARYAEAEKFIRSQIEIYQAMGAERDSQVYAICLNSLAGVQGLRGDWNEAAKTYAALDEATKEWEQARKDEIGLDVTRIFAAYHVNDFKTGLSAAERLVARQNERFGSQHTETLLARAVLAAGQFKAGRGSDAQRNFASVPLLLAAGRNAQSSDDDAVTAAAREQRVQYVVEAYMAFLATRGASTAAESLQLAEAIRGRSVQKALAASSARAVARDPALAAAARNEQDLQKQIGAQLGVLNNVLALPPAQRNEKTVAELRTGIEKLRKQHGEVRAQLVRQFPEYANFIDPKPPTIDELKATLRADEALISLYFGQDKTFVWALRKSGAIAFTAVSAGAKSFEQKIIKLREALEPNAATIAEIPAFDLALSYDLYSQLLKPVEAGWKPAKSLIVVTNGALGLLPLGLLTTAPATVKTTDVMFAGYRDVPWLARTHAVTLVPSAAALRTLRNLPPGSDKRERLIGFGDPLFSTQQAADAAREQPSVQVASATRGIPLARRSAPQTDGVSSAELALLPRLPDTADELKSIALALQADPVKALKLGKAASEDAVKKSDLSNYRIIVFATHGLVPGELDGLTQPALALSAPDVTGVPGDGLLTMEEILSLKLNADWVVLSACNTGTGAGAGAEAASGLGRAFFYAGTRAILVTNWSVHSASARELVTDLFRRQTADARLTRGEALRQASMALADNAGFKDDSGKMIFSYAHPLFWAPYTIIGDGG